METAVAPRGIVEQRQRTVWILQVLCWVKLMTLYSGTGGCQKDFGICTTSDLSQDGTCKRSKSF